ncbi:BamA/TamA family outer membrane protein [Vibrio maerlii]|uniref:BamA/TamA family outer membrane protein n=1 Tax=Vibrio maerlii TaxID=2231648 RepID=UPI000E3E128C|nr:BamA/TamA family outer membrane protein [Vibrio maerlii]
MFRPLLLAALIATQASASDDQNTSVHRAADNIPDNTFKVVAIPFYDPSVSAGVSVVPIYAFHAGENTKSASTISATLTYTENESYYFTGNTDLLLNNDKLRFVSEFGFRHTNLTLTDVLDITGELDITEETYYVIADVYNQIIPNLYAGLGVNYESTRFLNDFTDNDFKPDLGLRLSLLWDTRDHYYVPSSGFAWKITYEDHSSWLGNEEDASYSSISADYRHFHSLNASDNHVVALKVVGRYLLDKETAPKSALTTYGRQGKETQRGFEVGNYIGAHLVNSEIEYRYRINNSGYEWLDKVSTVGFAGVGKVFDGPIGSFSEAETLSMVGVGLRYAIIPKERINVRMDITYSSDNEVLAYFSLGESI